MDDGFYFNEWALLAQLDPDAFERRRRELLTSFIGASGRRSRGLEALQRRIDQVRDEAVSPDAAAEAIFRLMCGSLGRLMDELGKLKTELQALEGAQPGNPAMAAARLPVNGRDEPDRIR